MTAHKTELESRCAELQHQIALIDMGALQQAVTDAKQAASVASANAPDPMLRRSEQQALLRLSGAENDLADARRQVDRLQSELRPLSAMLTGAARTAEAQPAVDAAAANVAAALAQVEQARQTVARLDEQLAGAQTAHATAAHAAALDLLAAARYGTPAADAPQGASAERVRIATTEHALSLARDELTQAEQVHVAATAELDAARETLQAAQRDAARLGLELALHELAPQVVAYRRLGGLERPVEVFEKAIRAAERAH